MVGDLLAPSCDDSPLYEYHMSRTSQLPSVTSKELYLNTICAKQAPTWYKIHMSPQGAHGSYSELTVARNENTRQELGCQLQKN